VNDEFFEALRKAAEALADGRGLQLCRDASTGEATMTTATPPWNRRGARAVTEANAPDAAGDVDPNAHQGHGHPPEVWPYLDLIVVAAIVGFAVWAADGLAWVGDELAWLVGQFV
jgi:hypothetical protein